MSNSVVCGGFVCCFLFGFLFYFYFLFLKQGLSIALAVLEVTMKTRLVSNPQRPVGLCSVYLYAQNNSAFI